jgi:2-polyprenyl-3-methyl-5-hydroxy-6-metoxy-1,4-benzoquinol methylase
MDNYTALYEIAASLIPEQSTVFELGCGTGVFASMIIPKCKQYTGFDIDKKSLEEARQNNMHNQDAFRYQDIQEDDAYKHMGTYVALEVMEHLRDDLTCLKKIRRGCRVILSVPSFDSVGHERFFPYEHSTLLRYSDILDIDLWRKIKIPTGGGYFHLIRGFA